MGRWGVWAWGEPNPHPQPVPKLNTKFITISTRVPSQIEVRRIEMGWEQVDTRLDPPH